MRFSKAFIPTLKENPADAEIPSHQLMIRSGMIRQLAAGIYSELPFGWRSAKKAMQIVREEMDRIGAQELFLPSLNPIEVWEETGRAAGFGDELFRLEDRKGRGMCLAPTHEEIICDIARGFIKSYRDLPQIWYQLQTKMRDEPRPRSGVLRGRQFIMKDSYSLDIDQAGLDKSYELHSQAYHRIFERCGLEFFVVGASSGLMGGTGSQEFMVASEHGEDRVALCPGCGYAANLEVAASRAIPIADPDEGDSEIEKVSTPDTRTIEEVSKFLKVKPERLIKTLVIISEEKPVMLLIAGDDDLEEAKLQGVLGAPFRPAHPEEIEELFGCEAGFLGPVNAPQMPIIADSRIMGGKHRITGANENHFHITGVEVGRHFKPDQAANLRAARSGEGCPNCQETLRVTNAIEIGHIFKLGTKYSSAMGAKFLDANGKEQPIIMGSYGIGIARIIACAIESNHDKDGIIWPLSLTPYEIVLIGINMKEAEVSIQTEALYADLLNQGFDVLFDDRDLRPGFKFKDADLLGIPYQIVISPKTIAEDKVEFKQRNSGARQVIKLEEALQIIRG
ncbi:proline--tRNA ligase [bacterium]|nr:proline--tRNA ligase [bacterium]